MQLVTNGDSNTYGSGLSPIGTDPQDWPGGSIHHQQNSRYALENSWPAQLAKSLNFPHVNLSKPGASNDHIVRTTLDHLAKTPGSDQLVIIAWTEPSRRDIHLIDHLVQYWANHPPHGYRSFRISGNDIELDPKIKDRNLIKWAQRFYRYGWDDVESHVRYYTQIVLLTSYLKQRSIPYLYINSIHCPHSWQEWQEGYAAEMTRCLYDLIDWNDFVMRGNETMMNMLKGMLDKTLHPTLGGHQHLATLLHQELKDRKLITV